MRERTGLETYRIDQTPITGKARDFWPIEFVLVNGTEEESLWDHLIRTWHYLGFNKMIGPRLKYLLKYNDKLIGAISFVGGALKLKSRDSLIGATEKDFRQYVLPHILNNNRFLILPWVNVRNLASKMLSGIVPRLRTDWSKKYGNEPYALETFVDISKYKGTGYKAANWQYLGETGGFEKVGKEFVYHGNKKGIFFRVINKRKFHHLAIQYCRPPVQKEVKEKILKPLQERISETTIMISGLPIWDPNLFNDIDLNELTVTTLAPRLLSYLDDYNTCFNEPEHADYFVTYIKGLLSDTNDRKNIENIANALMIPKKVRSLQLFIKNFEWCHEKAQEIYQKNVYDFADDPNGMITVDETSFLKWGKNSFGVGHQYLGCVGKTANGQVGVFVGYAGKNGHGLLDEKLYVPKNWFVDSEKLALWPKSDVPEDLTFQTKPQIATELIQKVIQLIGFSFKWVGCDCLYGCNKEFRDSIPENIYFFADLRRNQIVYVNGVQSRVDKIAEDETIPWQTVERYIGSKGPTELSFKCLRVNENDDNKPGAELWLYIRKNANDDVRYALSNAPADIEIVELHSASFLRWSIEQSFKECKDFLGMGHYETRSYRGWHRHMLLIKIAHLFLNKVRHMFKKTFISNPPNDNSDMMDHEENQYNITSSMPNADNTLQYDESLSSLEPQPDLSDPNAAPVKYLSLPVLTIQNAFKLVSAAIRGINKEIQNAIIVISNDIKNYHRSILSYCKRYLRIRLPFS